MCLVIDCIFRFRCLFAKLRFLRFFRGYSFLHRFRVISRTDFQVVMIIEFRIPLPITVSDFQVAQLAMVITAQEKVTGGGEGIVVLKNEP